MVADVRHSQRTRVRDEDTEDAAAARQVAEALSDRDLAYTTWLTVLTRLEKKGVLERTPAGRAHAYAARGSRAEHTAVLMQQALGQADDREAALQRFADALGSAAPASH